MDGGYLTADEAATRLGVSRRTLYAYVSRGLVVSEPERGSGSRSHRYPREAIDELLARRERRRDPAMRAHGALTHGMPVLDSAITLIADGRLWYRGRDALELSRTATLEQVALLLWTGSAEDADGVFPRSASRGRARSIGPPADRVVAALAKRPAESAVTLAEAGPAAVRAAARTIRRLFDAAGARGPGDLAARLARGWPGTSADDLRAALILCADHELNTSTFVARCVASTDAPLNDVLLGALCALKGRRHGGAAGADCEELIRRAERLGARRACGQAVSRHGWLPGFAPGGHVFYPDGDPRAEELLARLALRPREAVAQVVAFAREELGAHPGLEFALVAIARKAALADGAAFAMFALGRSVGWVAHGLEAAAEGRLIRPRARYVGPPPETTA